MPDGRKNNGSKKGENRGGGRKPVHDEIAARDISISAIVKEYGSIEEGMIALLRTKEQSLIKFVFEHAIGKPKEQVEYSGKMGISHKYIQQAGNNPLKDAD